LFAIHWLEQAIRRQLLWHLFQGGLVMVGFIGANPSGIDYFGYLAYAAIMARSGAFDGTQLSLPMRRQIFYQNPLLRSVLGSP
jgi:hypothetical protein